MRLQLICVALWRVGFLSDAVDAQTASFVAPPRNISDITAILDQQKPDPTKAEKTRSEADANAAEHQLTAARLGDSTSNVLRPAPRLAAPRKRSRTASRRPRMAVIFSQRLAATCNLFQTNICVAGNTKRGIEINEQLSRKTEELGRGKGQQFAANLRIVTAYLGLGDLDKADVYVKRSQALLNEIQGVEERRYVSYVL